jgi:hypothetical protein
MSKSEITLTCLYKDDGDTAQKIIFRSFGFFLQRELKREGQKFAALSPNDE